MEAEKQRERSEDDTLLALKMEDRAISQGMQVVFKTRKGNKMGFILEPPKGTWPFSQILDFRIVKKKICVVLSH